MRVVAYKREMDASAKDLALVGGSLVVVVVMPSWLSAPHGVTAGNVDLRLIPELSVVSFGFARLEIRWLIGPTSFVIVGTA